MRTGPKPLSFHVSMAASRLMFDVSGDVSDAAARQDMELMLRGIRLYQNHSLPLPSIADDIIWQKSSVTLRCVRASGLRAVQRQIFLVPSLVNNSSILDLCEQRSFARWLSREKDADVFILDWGDLCSDPEHAGIEEIICERLIPALDFVKNSTNSGTQDLCGLGYCMGGTLLLAVCALRPDLLDRAVFLATPWDFHSGSQKLTNHVRFHAPHMMPRIEQKGCLSSETIQALFASLDPELAQKKFTRFAAMDQESEDAHIFVAIEDWIHSGHDLPSGIAYDTIAGWFQENQTGAGEWSIGGQVINPADVQIPTLVVASSLDRLVDSKASFCLHSLLPHSELVDPECGHIGMIAGRGAVQKVWSPIGAWLS